MNNMLHINSEWQMLTPTQMNEIRGGDIIDVNEFFGAQEIELPKLPSLPASMPTGIPPVIIA